MYRKVLHDKVIWISLFQINRVSTLSSFIHMIILLETYKMDGFTIYNTIICKKEDNTEIVNIFHDVVNTLTECQKHKVVWILNAYCKNMKLDK